MTAKKATLALACGEVFEGTPVGAQGETVGEVVFNTAHTGYQEVLTDPSYVGQLVTFTVSEVGNYGIHFGDEQAETAQAAGLIARRVCKEPSNWRSQQSLPEFMEKLEPIVKAKLKPGARIVAHDFPFPHWKADQSVEFEGIDDSGNKRELKLYLYTVKKEKE